MRWIHACPHSMCPLQVVRWFHTHSSWWHVRVMPIVAGQHGGAVDMGRHVGAAFVLAPLSWGGVLVPLLWGSVWNGPCTPHPWEVRRSGHAHCPAYRVHAVSLLDAVTLLVEWGHPCRKEMFKLLHHCLICCSIIKHQVPNLNKAD